MKALTPPKEGDYYWGADYGEMIDSFEVDVLLQVDDNDYQGDSRVLLRDGDRFGLLFYGWGSCSGCDAAQACSNVGEATELRDELWGSVHWEDSAAALLAYVEGKDWSLDYSWHADETKQFLEQVKVLLAGVKG